MKIILCFFVLCWLRSGAASEVMKRQSGTASASKSSTSSVFSIPTPSVAPSVNASDHDLSKHFCRLWRHQSVYADGKIYVDGGNIYIPDNNSTYNNTSPDQYIQGMNDVILVIDLSANFSNQDTNPYSVIDKPPNVPNALIEGALWYSNLTRKIYQVGGWFSTNSEQDPGYITDAQLPESVIWEFDIDSHDWGKSSFNELNTGTKVERPGAANWCDAPALNRSFVFEGYVQKRSDHDYMNYTTNSEFKYLEGMLQLDSNSSPPTLSNISVPTYMGPRMNGAMIYVPVGEQGVIVQIAGQTTMDPTPYGVGITNANQFNTNINNSFVDIYDIETGYWFRQDTFGVPEIPSARADICTVLVTAEDKSSFNIFMIAGVETYNQVITDNEMWVLTLPTFQWVKVNTRPSGIWGHTCHIVGENLLVIGGMQNTETGGNAPNCSTHMPAEIFSLAQMAYTGIFDFEGATRNAPVPPDVVKLIGGTPSGGATVTKPDVWSSLYLQYIFTPSLIRPAFTPTYTLANGTTPLSTTTSSPAPKPPLKHKTPIGAIVGGVVGGLLLLTFLTILSLFLLRRRRNNKSKSHPLPSGSGAELPSYQDSKDAAGAVEVSSNNDEHMNFTPYRPFHPAEMDASPQLPQGEEHDHFPSAPIEATEGPKSPRSGRFSDADMAGTGTRSESRVSQLSEGSQTEAGTRTSRQSEVSRPTPTPTSPVRRKPLSPAVSSW